MKKSLRKKSDKRRVFKRLDQIRPTREAEFQRLDSISDEEINLDDIPEVTPGQFREMAANRRRRLASMGKRRITLYLSKALLEKYRSQGPGYQTRINDDLMLLDVLRERLQNA